MKSNLLKRKLAKVLYTLRIELMTILRRQILGVKAVIIDKKTAKILLVRHSYKDSTKWYLPGGAVWYGERPDIAIKRELSEELGLKVKNISLTGIYKGQNKSLTLLFVCKTNYDVANFNNKQFEIEEASFFSLNKLPRNTAYGVSKRIKDARIFLRQKSKNIIWRVW